MAKLYIVLWGVRVAKRRKSRRFPLSGDRVIDLEFKILVETIEQAVRAIHMKQELRDPRDRRKTLYGLLSGGGEIFLGRQKHRREKESLSKTLMHEGFHAERPPVKERRIYQLEAVYFTRFTDAQKRFLRNFIPKHIVKKDPA